MSGRGDDILTALSGALVGLSLGATGSGSAILAIPLLVYLVGTSVQTATSLSLALVALSGAIGAAEAFRSGDVRVKVGLLFSGTGLVGGVLGAELHPLLKPELLLVLLGMLMISAAGQMRWRSLLPRDRDSGRTCADRFPRSCRLKAGSLGFAVGVLTGVFGVGGGFIIVPALTLLLGFPIRVAVGTSLFIMTIVAAGGLAGHVRLGGLEGPMLLLLALGGIAGMLAGRALSRLVAQPVLTRSFAGFSVVVAAVLIIHNVLKLAGEAP